MPFLAMVLLGVVAQAEVPRGAGEPPPHGRMAVVAIGRCEEPRLGQAARALRAELRLQRGAEVLSEEETARPAGGLPGSSQEQIHQAIDAARSRFFSLDYGAAEAVLRRVISEIDRLPPGPERWEAAARARIELAHVSMFNLKRGVEGPLLRSSRAEAPAPQRRAQESREAPDSSAPLPWMRAGGIAMGFVAAGLAVAALVEGAQASRAQAEIARLISGPAGGMKREQAGEVAARIGDFGSTKERRDGLAIGAAAAAAISGGLLFFSLEARRGEGGAWASVTAAGKF